MKTILRAAACAAAVAVMSIGGESFLAAGAVAPGLPAVAQPGRAAAQPGSTAAPAGALPLDAWAAKIQAGWTGKVAAGSGALPTEMWPKERIKEKYGVLSTPPQKPTPRGPLDDTTLAFLGWQAARERGPAFTMADVARQWVEHLPDADLKGGGFGRGFLDNVARLRRGQQPPIRTGNSGEEWIAAQMRAEIWGMLAPGEPTRAAEYARRDAEVLNRGNGVYAARFTAALASLLMADPEIDAAIAGARKFVPANEALARMIDDTLRWHAAEPNDWEKVWQQFVDTYRDRSMEKRFAAWSPDWLVETGGWPEADVLPEYRGRRSVLRTHPFSDTEPARLTTEVSLPPSGGALRLRVNCNDLPANVDWLLRVRIDNQAREEPVRWTNGAANWQQFEFDLKPWAGKRVTLVLENALLGKMAWEAGFWCPPELVDGDGKPLRGERPAGGVYRYPLDFAPKILPETFSVLVGLLYGGGDFRRSVSLATMCGFDTDCNAGTVGCLLGIRNGLDGIPAEWKDPVADTYELQVTGYPRQWRISELARQMAETGVALARGPQAPAAAGPAEVWPPADPGTAGPGGGAPTPGTAGRPTLPGAGQATSGAGPATPGAPAATAAQATPPLDPPEGFGASTKGGEGGRMIEVTTLADSGPGSLREALSARGPRVIRFAVEGTIELQSRLRCTNGQVTIDGASAPGKGITLLNHGIQFREGCDDIIVRDLRIRVLTGGADGDCLLFWGNQGDPVERVLVDHCSLMWATDEVVNTWGLVKDMTCQWTVIAEAQMPHSKAWLSGVGSDRVSIHHCLFAQNADRAPKLEGGLYDFVNNVVYNWGNNNAAKIETGAHVNLVNNSFIPGPQSVPASGCIFPQDADKGTRIWASGNIGPYTPNGTEEQWANATSYDQVNGKWVETRPAPEAYRAAQAFPTEPIRTQAAKDAYDQVLARAGARVRDADDLRVLQAVKDRGGRVGKGR